MDEGNSVSVLWYRTSKPLGKVRRRVQDLRVPSSSFCDFTVSRTTLDLSHNESARLAADCLLSQGLEGYHEVLGAEGEVDFLSKQEKNYILENRRNGNADDPDASDDDAKELESLSAGSQSPSWGPALSTDSDPTVAGLDLKDVKPSECILEERSLEVAFQSDSRAAGMKDLVRQFIRKAKLALAIVIDSFSDIELLCDLLEVSRKRNVSVHLLLDHLNMNLFVSTWQDLKLDSRNFPKLSVRSVHGQTYCAKTGMKLSGQIAESFVIADWTEVLTGSFSFSWLSWQVHRGFTVILKGSSVTSFNQEFHRLYSSSKPVAGFVTFITVPQTLCLHSTSHAAQSNNSGIRKRKSKQTKTMCLWAWNENAENAQTKTTQAVLCNPQSPEVECGKGDEQAVHRAGAASQTQRKPPQQQSVSVEKPKATVGAVCTQPHARTNVGPLEKNQNQIHSQSNPLDQTQLSHVQTQLAGLKTSSEKRVQESNPLRTASPTHGQHTTVQYQSALKKSSHLGHPEVGPFFQRNRNILTKTSGFAAGANTQRGQWNYSLNFKPKVELQSPSTSQTKQAKPNPQFTFTSPRGHTSGHQTKVSFLETRRPDQLQTHCQPPLQSHTTSTGVGAHLMSQLQTVDSKLFLPGAGAKLHLQPHASQQVHPPLWLNRSPQNHPAAGPGVLVRQSSLSSTRGTGQLGWRPLQSSMMLGRSKSMTDRLRTGFNPNRS